MKVGCSIAFAMMLAIVVAVFGVFYKYTIGNKQLIDFKQNFKIAYISMPDNSVIKVDVDKWNDYDRSDTIQIISKDGKTYYTHISRAVLISE